MSTLESVIWHILGYSAIPIIVLAGLVISTVIFFALQRLLGGPDDEQ
ncbi:MAG: TIGR02808 family protein [Gammaproteobacteria bacterium]